MCSYKVVRVKFEIWGLQTRVEGFTQKVSRSSISISGCYLINITCFNCFVKTFYILLYRLRFIIYSLFICSLMLYYFIIFNV